MNVAGLTATEIATRLLAMMPKGSDRKLVALAGPPASGKSALAEAVVTALNESGRSAGLLPMDGFHLDNAILDARGLRARKGAPETFDLAGFAAMLGRVKAGETVVVPRFDRDLDASIAGCDEITKTTEIVVVEGNYLLLDQPGWRGLMQFWDYAVFLDVPEDVLKARLIKRWADHGFDEATALTKAEGNDLPNARLVLETRVAAVDLTLTA